MVFFAAGCDTVELSFHSTSPEVEMHLELSVKLEKILNGLYEFSFSFLSFIFGFIFALM